jgi:hypothetical protein
VGSESLWHTTGCSSSVMGLGAVTSPACSLASSTAGSTPTIALTEGVGMVHGRICPHRRWGQEEVVVTHRDLYLTGGTRVGVDEGEIVTLGVQI